MSRHHVSGATPNFDVGKSWRLCSRTARIARFAVATLILWLAALSFPLLADAASPQPGNAQPAANGEKFGQYLDEHEADLAPFVSNNGGYLAQQAVPAAMQMVGWIFVVGMLVGWGIDVVMSRGLAFFFAPAYAEIKRSIVYATGRLVLSFVYLCLMGLALVICVEFSSGGFVLPLPDDPVCLAWVPPGHHPGSVGGRPFHGEIDPPVTGSLGRECIYR